MAETAPFPTPPLDLDENEHAIRRISTPPVTMGLFLRSRGAAGCSVTEDRRPCGASFPIAVHASVFSGFDLSTQAAGERPFVTRLRRS